MKRRHTPSQRALWLAVILAIVISTVGLLTSYMGERDKKETAQVQAADAATEGQKLADEVLGACRAGGDDAVALSAAGLCGKAATTKDNIDETVKDAPGTTTTTTIVRREVLPPGTLFAAIRSALTSTCGADGCRDGRSGKNGDDGGDSTVPGPSGATGATGATGAKGEKGDAGPAGKDGADGSDGADGTDGRGIASLVCTTSLAPITFTLTLTDGTTQEFTCGSGAVDSAPDPTE